MSLCEVVCAWSRWCCLRRGMCLASREHHTLLLAFDFITHEVPDILIECFVFGLPDEADLVWWQIIRIHHTVASGCAYLGEQVTPCSFWCRNGSGAVAVYGCVLAVGTLAVVVASAVLFGDFAWKVMDWVFVGYYSHNVFGNEQEYDNKNYKQLDLKLSNISWNLFKTIQVNFDVNFCQFNDYLLFLPKWMQRVALVGRTKWLFLLGVRDPLCRERGLKGN